MRRNCATGKTQDSEMIVYGRLPLDAQRPVCAQKYILDAITRKDRLVLKDRYDKEFPAVCCCHPWKTGNTKETGPCYNIIYNSLPYGLLKGAEQGERTWYFSLCDLSFTIETAGKRPRRIAGRLYGCIP